MEEMQAELAQLSQVVKGMRSSRREVRHRTPNTRQPRIRTSNDEAESYNDYEEEDRVTRKKDRRDDNINSIKMKISPFKGRNDAEAYLKWESKVELVFDYHNYNEGKKIKLAAF